MAVRHASCLYEGTVRHRRPGFVPDELRHSLFMTYLDLDELPALFDTSALWSARRPALAWFRRADYLGERHVPLKQAVLALVKQRTGERPDGPVRLLTHLRSFGHCFNPVSFYYCFTADGERLAAVVAEVSNTPWGERHAYVMSAAGALDRGTVQMLHCQLDKQLHVSPLMGMERRYDWRLTMPAEQLFVHIESHPRSAAEGTFDATLSLRRREIDARSLRRALLRYPLMSVQAQAHIYSHALRMRLRGARWYPHPGTREASP
ncbi:MAG TPA: DUF1365 domain-containing protein [Solirubrobacteraceae bacterium]|jgi:hypothetical protein